MKRIVISKRIVIPLAPLLSANAAFAHPAIVAHDHPHGLSALAGLDFVLVAALALAAFGLLALRRR